jgi:hemolysin III
MLPSDITGDAAPGFKLRSRRSAESTVQQGAAVEQATPGSALPPGGEDGREIGDAFDHLVEAVRPHLRGWLHLGGFGVSLLSGALLVVLTDSGLVRGAVTIYAVSVTLMFGTSALYHRRSHRWSTPAQRVMMRLDHSMIFVLIAGTYTPFALLVLEGAVSTVVLTVVWVGALGGIGFRVLAPDAPRWSTVPVYLVLGWTAVPVVPQIYQGGGALVLLLIALGGLFYTVGGVVYGARRPDPSPRWFGFHEIFHALTLAAFVTHYWAVALVAFRVD